MPKKFLKSKKSVSMSSKLAKLERKVNKQKPETRIADIAYSFANATTAGSVILCQQIAQGDAINQREANSIRMTSMSFKAYIRGYTAGNRYRFYIILDKQQQQNTAPTQTLIWGNATPNPNFNFPATTTTSRFKVLWKSPILEGDRLISGDQSANMECYLKLQNQTTFGNPSSTDIQKNGIYVVFITDDAGNTVDCDGYIRNRYYDV